MIVQVELTQDDIDEGVRGKCMECPVALAIERATKRVVAVWANCFAFGPSLKTYSLPLVARSFITAFDNGWLDEIKPISFPIEIDA